MLTNDIAIRFTNDLCCNCWYVTFIFGFGFRTNCSRGKLLTWITDYINNIFNLHTHVVTDPISGPLTSAPPAPLGTVPTDINSVKVAPCAAHQRGTHDALPLPRQLPAAGPGTLIPGAGWPSASR